MRGCVGLGVAGAAPRKKKKETPSSEQWAHKRSVAAAVPRGRQRPASAGSHPRRQERAPVVATPASPRPLSAPKAPSNTRASAAAAAEGAAAAAATPRSSMGSELASLVAQLAPAAHVRWRPTARSQSHSPRRALLLAEHPRSKMALEVRRLRPSRARGWGAALRQLVPKHGRAKPRHTQQREVARLL